MCVILVCSARPSASLVRDAYEANPHGAGIAWRDAGKVHWQKDLDCEALLEAVREVPLPCLVHCRIPTCDTDGALTHPFPLGGALDRSGATEGAVIMHNGHWADWLNAVVEASDRRGVEIPDGPWSDTRAMAWLAGLRGLGWLSLLGERVAWLSPTELRMLGTGWSTVADGVTASNRHFLYPRSVLQPGGLQLAESFRVVTTPPAPTPPPPSRAAVAAIEWVRSLNPRKVPHAQPNAPRR